MLDLATLWQFLCSKFEERFSVIPYKTWIATAKPIQFIDNTLVIEVPSILHRDYWTQNITPLVQEFFKEESNANITVLVKTPDQANPFQLDEATTETENLAPNKQKKNFMQNSQLNEKFTFDTFIVGKGNQMAHAAALAVAEEPGGPSGGYNPLFFYGGVGLGKTHLMHAIGHQMLANKPDAKVKYVTSESFANDFINSIQTKRQEEFRQEYRNVDLLLVDDIQFFADKVGTQEEFFHTFNALHNEKKQIVLSSDRLPNEIPKLEERLVSRFKGGLSVDITPPDFETRIAILRNKAEAEHLSIPDEALSYIAGQIDNNVRELEGALLRVQAFASTNGRPVTTDLVAEALKNLKPHEGAPEITIALIQAKVSKYYQVTVAELKGKKRIKSIVMPRQIAMYLARQLTEESFPKIGEEFGGKDHTTVIHACEKIEESLTTDQKLQTEIAILKSEIKG